MSLDSFASFLGRWVRRSLAPASSVAAVGRSHFLSIRRLRVAEAPASGQVAGNMKIALLSYPLLRALALSGALVLLVSNLLPWRGEEGPLLAWEEMNEGIKLQASIVSLVFAGEESRTLYAATYDPGGVYRSGEGGLSWRKIAAGLEKHTILSLAAHPGDGETIFAGAVDGAFSTRDEGASWRPMGGGLPATNVYAWAFVGDGPVTVYAATDSGLYDRGNGGETWESVRGLLGEVPILCVVADPSDAGRLYAGTAGEGLYLSTDRGVSWLSIEEVGDFSSVTALARPGCGRE